MSLKSALQKLIRSVRKRVWFLKAKPVSHRPVLDGLLGNAAPSDTPKAMIDIGSMLTRHGIVPRGVIHVGAHQAGELDEYLRLGFAKILYVEANPALIPALREKAAAHPGKVVLCGVGKSGLIGQKVAATLCSTGTPAIFLHAADAVHGDLGILQAGDPVVLISRSGTTAELVRLIPVLRSFKSPIIAIVGNTQSPLATQADVVLDIGARPEADPLGLVPTTSALLTLALGDALAAPRRCCSRRPGGRHRRRR